MAEGLPSIDKPGSRNIWKFAATTVPFLLLAIPSFCLLLSVPPPWRSLDAYNQTVRPPGLVTILLHGPLYDSLIRIPLWFWYFISGSGPVESLVHFIKHTQLTDAGVYSLLVLQHVALWCGAVYLIYPIARTLLLRLFLAACFASQPLFYAFAHCVGSEALSMIVILLLTASGVRLMLHYPDISVRDWIIFTVFLAAASLTRHINNVLAALLPTALILVLIESGLRRLVACRQVIAAAKAQFRKATKVFLMSIATGVIGLMLAMSVSHLLCWRARLPWHSTFGYTFFWRLNFPEAMQSDQRRELLDTIASKSKLPESREMLDLLRTSMDRNKDWEPISFLRGTHSAFSDSEMKFHSEKFDRVLNEIASRFLYPPIAPLRSAALSDFATSTRSTESEIAQFLFVDTDYFFSHRDKMLQCSGLITFREPRDRLTTARELSYFRWWNLLSFRAWSIVGLVLLSSALVADHKRGRENTPVIFFAVSLWIVGMTLMFLNCFMVEVQPRFVLPMMELLLLSLIILCGVLFRGFESPTLRDRVAISDPAMRFRNNRR